MKRILVVTYYWPPTGGSGVQRWVKFSKYLPAQGWQPVIYTPENPEQLARDESLLGDIPSGTEVLKTPIREPYDIYRRIFGRKKGGAAGGEVNPLNSRKKGAAAKLAVWVRGNFFVPDPRIFWVKPSVRFLKKYLLEHPVDAIVTTGPPQSMHLVGLGLKKALGTGCPRWIVDFRDPWTEMFYFKHMGLGPLARRRHEKLEQEVLDACNDIISVTPLVQKDFQSRTSTPVHLITNGFDPDDFSSEDVPWVEGEFRVTHTGLFAADGNPLELWGALSDKCAAEPSFRQALRIRLAGKVDADIVEAINAAGLGENLCNLGYLPHDKTSLEQRQADILMLPLRQEPEYRKVLPGKIFEYLAARRPVLGVGQEDGAAATVLADCGAGQMFEWDRRDEMRAFVDREWERRKAGGPVGMNSDIGKYSRPELTAALVRLLEK